MGIDTGETVSSNVDICNMALVKVGQSPIGSFGDPNDRAKSVAILYFRIRDALLRKLPWNFARTWVSLTQLQAAPLNLDIITPPDRGTGQVVFTNAFQLPNDCLRVHRFSPKDAAWRVIGRTIYTNTSQSVNPGPLLGVQPPPDDQPPSASVNTIPVLVGIEYIKRVTDTSLFDQLFIEALWNKMAMEIAFGQNGLEQIVSACKEDFRNAMLEAAYVNGVENNDDALFDTSIVDVRMGYGNSGIDFGGNS